MSDQPQNYPQNPQNGYAPNGYAQPQQPQQAYSPQPQGNFPPGWAPQQPVPQYGYTPPGFAPRHKIPGAALAASIMWIIYGSLQLVGTIAGLGMGGRPGVSTVIGAGIGIWLLMAGIQTSTGKARGTVANGVCSIVLGAIVALLLLAAGSLLRGFGGAAGIFAVLGLLFGGILITAGILACVSNKKYQEYHHTKFGGF